MTKPIRKAVFPVAGLGTQFLTFAGRPVRSPAQRHSRAKHKTLCQLYRAACQTVPSPAARAWALRTETGSGMSL
jgi:hypothetical protein